MFTGIISDIGRIKSVNLNQETMRARIICNYDMNTVAIGASIACDGVCLTVIACENDAGGNWFDVDISSETLNVTNLKTWAVEQNINCERAMKIGDEIGGHIVSGHVDGLAKITQIEKSGDNTVIRFSAPDALAKFIAPKGSVCLNGTSLTVNAVDKNAFTVNLIPHTLNVTTWKEASQGDEVNLEIDLMARYVARLREFDN